MMRLESLDLSDDLVPERTNRHSAGKFQVGLQYTPAIYSLMESTWPFETSLPYLFRDVLVRWQLIKSVELELCQASSHSVAVSGCTWLSMCKFRLVTTCREQCSYMPLRNIQCPSSGAQCRGLNMYIVCYICRSAVESPELRKGRHRHLAEQVPALQRFG